MIKAIESFHESYKAHPAMTLFVLLSVCSVAVFGNQTYADKQLTDARFETNGQKVDALAAMVKAGMQDMKIRDIEEQIFALERVIDGGSGRESDHTRLNALQSDLNAIERRI